MAARRSSTTSCWILADESIGRVASRAAPSARNPTDTSVEIIYVDDDCVGRLLADAIGQLAAENEVGEIDEPAFEKPPA